MNTQCKKIWIDYISTVNTPSTTYTTFKLCLTQICVVGFSVVQQIYAATVTDLGLV